MVIFKIKVNGFAIVWAISKGIKSEYKEVLDKPKYPSKASTAHSTTCVTFRGLGPGPSVKLLRTRHPVVKFYNFYGNFTFLWICWTLQNCAELNREKKPQVPGAGRGAVAAGGSKSLLRAGFQSKYMFQIFSIQTHLNLHIFEFDLNNALNYCQ